jgi:glycerophosphoryl diester phosphodiesterase
MTRLLSILSLCCFALMSAGAPQRTLVHGHRGARARFPENTLPAFEYAIKQGVDAIEFDLHATRDNVLVVSHDATLKPPICTGPKADAPIRQLTLAEVKQWDCGATRNPLFAQQQTVPGTRIPTFDEVLDLSSRGKFEFNLEMKSDPNHPEYVPAPDDFARMVLERIRAHKLEDRCMVQSFDWRTLVALRKLSKTIRMSALFDKDTRDFVTIAKEAGNAQIVSPQMNLVTPEKVEAAHKAGLVVVPWTPNTVEQWDRLIAAKVDAIITDDPATLIAHLNQKK